ncbi:unnamed protein product [Oppiella nova]|uniref:Uncharacterized protein n=1 Tax=Oppiella nova TaxID=334625 RepID=A0A7R9QLM6_9ACAR|nr:unnamed protein product [Oppiella nova]CAG2168328.1 unnamed protein product [Oppiella nova]
MSLKKLNIKCDICGDKAVGRNFGAVTCESCKTFIRSKELEVKSRQEINEQNDGTIVCVRSDDFYECNTDNSIFNEIIENVTTTDDRLEKRMNEIESYLSHNKTINFNHNPQDVLKLRFTPVFRHIEDFHSFNELTLIRSKELEVKSRQEINEQNDGTIVCVRSNPFYECNTDNSVFHEIIENVTTTDDRLEEQLNEIESYLSHNKTINFNHNPQDVLKLRFTPVFRHIEDFHSFNELESKRLSELFSASNVFTCQSFSAENVFEMTDVLTVYRICGVIMDRDAKDVIKFTKKLNTFNNICANDQLALIKYGCLEVLLLRYTMLYDINTEYWTWVLMTAIVLFNPNRPNLIHRDVVKAEQQLYIYLLQRYLYLRYRSDLETQSKLLKLMNPLTDLQIICDIEKENGHEFYLETYGPILKEILYDITH